MEYNNINMKNIIPRGEVMLKMFLGEQVVYNDERKKIMDSVNKTKQELDAAYQNFGNVTDSDLVDCYIFEVQSIQKRYEYLLKEAKKLKFT